MPDVPIACSLTPEAIRARRADLLPGLIHRAAASEPLADGLRLRFDASSDILHVIAASVDAERQCCRFLQFDLRIEPDFGPIWLTLTGPPGTTAFLDALVQA